MTTALDERPPAAEAAATRLYRIYGRQIYRFCLGRLRSREEAEDAVQSTFLRVHTALQRGVVPQFEAAWLYKIAHNVCLSRSETLGRRMLVESPQDIHGLDRPGVAPEEERREELRALAEALEAMPPNLRRVILLREWQGLSYAEIAAELGVSVSAVETLVFRARRRLAALLHEAGARPARRTLDLASALAALRGLLSRLGATAPAKLAAGAAVLAVGGTGVVAGIVVGDGSPRPRTSPAPTLQQAAYAAAAAHAVLPAPHVRTFARRGAAAAPAGSTVASPTAATTASPPTGAAAAPEAATTAAAHAATAPWATPTAPAARPVTTTSLVPTAPLPSVDPTALPTLTAPTLTAPTLTTPTLTAPELTTPTLTTPTLPTVTQPTLTQTAVPTLPAVEPPPLPVTVPTTTPTVPTLP